MTEMYLPTLDQIRQMMHEYAEKHGNLLGLIEKTGLNFNTVYCIRSGRHKSPRYVTIRKLLQVMQEDGIAAPKSAN